MQDESGSEEEEIDSQERDNTDEEPATVKEPKSIDKWKMLGSHNVNFEDSDSDLSIETTPDYSSR